MPSRERRAKSLGIRVEDLRDGRGRHGNHAKGKMSHRWNTGKIISCEGYVKVRVGKEHPFADSNGYAYEHLIVWASCGKPKPREDQILHHRNGDKTDNRVENLEIMQRADHSRLHINARDRDAAGRLLDGREWNEFPGGEK